MPTYVLTSKTEIFNGVHNLAAWRKFRDSDEKILFPVWIIPYLVRMSESLNCTIKMFQSFFDVVLRMFTLVPVCKR